MEMGREHVWVGESRREGKLSPDRPRTSIIWTAWICAHEITSTYLSSLTLRAYSENPLSPFCAPARCQLPARQPALPIPAQGGIAPFEFYSLVQLKTRMNKWYTISYIVSVARRGNSGLDIT